MMEEIAAKQEGYLNCKEIEIIKAMEIIKGIREGGNED